MTKRDSSFAGIDSPRVPMSVPRRHFAIRLQHGSGAASSETASSSTNARVPLPSDMNPPQRRPDETGTNVEARHFGYTAMIPPVPLPHGYTSDHQGDAYPLQSEMSQSHRVLHTHIFKEVMSPPESGRPSRLMVTEVDRYGVERNRQPEFFYILLQWNCWSCALL